MGGVGQLFDSILASLGLDGIPFIHPLIFVVILALVWPLMQRFATNDRARRLVKSLPELPLAEREAVQQRALEMVGGEPQGLLVIAEEALRVGMKVYATSVLQKLEATGKLPEDVRRLQRELQGAAPVMPEQAALAVERLLEAGALGEARRRLDEALTRWPEHPDLIALRDQIRAGDNAAPAEG